jgi:hypothetical protein
MTQVKTYTLTYGPERKVYTLTEVQDLWNGNDMVGFVGKCQERDNQIRAFRFDRFADIDHPDEIVDADIYVGDSPDESYIEGGNIHGRPLTDSEIEDVNKCHRDWVEQKAWDECNGQFFNRPADSSIRTCTYR